MADLYGGVTTNNLRSIYYVRSGSASNRAGGLLVYFVKSIAVSSRRSRSARARATPGRYDVYERSRNSASVAETL